MNPRDDQDPIEPSRWGAASYWRAGIAVLGLMILGTLIFRLFA